MIPTRAQINGEVHTIVMEFAKTDGIKNLAALLVGDLGSGSIGRLEIDHSLENDSGLIGAAPKPIATVTVNYEELRDAIDMSKDFRLDDAESSSLAATNAAIIKGRIKPIANTLFRRRSPRADHRHDRRRDLRGSDRHHVVRIPRERWSQPSAGHGW
jgi:hypothetical protein